jgi:hypothetical protein
MAAGTYVSHCHLFALVAPTQHDHSHGSHGGGTATGVAFFCGLPFVYTCVGLLAIFLVARLLLRVAEQIGRALVSRPARRTPRATVARPRWSSWSPRPGLLARLAAPRAPPLATVAV